VETIEAPEITGAVIVCGGGGDAAVREQIYKAASAALGIPTAKIYVAKIR
jgi:stage III sporulation protein AG